MQRKDLNGTGLACSSIFKSQVICYIAFNPPDLSSPRIRGPRRLISRAPCLREKTGSYGGKAQRLLI